MIYALTDHKIWLAVLLCVVAGWIWLTWEYHQAPTETESDDYPKIDDFYDHI